jgi:hemerythrin-like domain-containing protein
MRNHPTVSKQPRSGLVYLAAGSLLAAGAFAASAIQEENDGHMTPGEDLMREHGVLQRLLLIYDEAERRLGEPRLDLPPRILQETAALARTFVEDHHERLEEKFLFPRLVVAGKLIDLIGLLNQHHDAGRHLTDRIQQLSSNLKAEADRRQLRQVLQQFNHMYRVHAAREDTILFPAFRKLVSRNEYDALGEEFLRKERETFGEDGFENIVECISNIERQLGIHDVSRLAPQPSLAG